MEDVQSLLQKIDDLEKRIEYLSKDTCYGIWTREAFLQFCDVMPRGFRAVIFLDFDRIHDLNEEIGYEEVNIRIRATLTHDFRASDLVARWYSGDEIVILIDGDNNTAEMKAKELKEEARKNGLGFAHAIGTWEVGKSCVTAIVDELSRNLIRTAGRGQHDSQVNRAETLDGVSSVR